LRKAYLNMSPAQTLKWIEAGKGPAERNVEIEGTEPYVVGGHTASGYWINDKRQTTLQGLYAAGDVAGGCPQKYVTGAFVEGELAAKAVQEYIFSEGVYRDNSMSAKQNEEKYSEVQHFFASENDLYTAAELEEAMQKTMDDYAGGIARQYRFNETQLNIADKRIRRIEQLSNQLGAKGELYKLLQIYELRERLMVCKVLIAHLRARKETRWHSFAENLDYPDKSSDWERYVNSKLENGEVKIIFRELIRRGEHYEHKN